MSHPYDDDYSVGWWRHASHRRKIEKARSDSLAKAVGRAVRGEAMKQRLAVAAIVVVPILLAALLAAALAAVGALVRHWVAVVPFVIALAVPGCAGRSRATTQVPFVAPGQQVSSFLVHVHNGMQVPISTGLVAVSNGNYVVTRIEPEGDATFSVQFLPQWIYVEVQTWTVPIRVYSRLLTLGQDYHWTQREVAVRFPP